MSRAALTFGDARRHRDVRRESPGAPIAQEEEIAMTTNGMPPCDRWGTMVRRIGSRPAFPKNWNPPLFRPSERRIGTSYAMPVRCQVWLRITDCSGESGPQVSMLASLLLSAIQVRTSYRAAPEPTG